MPRVEVRSIPEGDSGTLATVRRMRALVIDRCAHPAIRDVAVSLGLGLQPHAQASAIRTWLAAHIRFQADPETTELLHDPVLMAQWIRERGIIGVDCDDVAIMGAALGCSLGIPTRFVVVGFFSPNAPYTHVWAELFDGRDWRELDTTRMVQGIEDGRIRRRLYMDVVTGQVTKGDDMPMVSRTRRVGVIPGRRPSLGFAIAPIIAAAPSFIQAMGPLLGGSKEPDRIAANQKAETLALAGNAAALEFLRCRSVQNVVCGNIPGYGDIGGWATETARADALKRYNNVIGTLGTTGAGGGITGTIPGVGSASVSTGTLVLAAAAAFFLLRR
jgi:hypothetical protein